MLWSYFLRKYWQAGLVAGVCGVSALLCTAAAPFAGRGGVAAALVLAGCLAVVAGVAAVFVARGYRWHRAAAHLVDAVAPVRITVSTRLRPSSLSAFATHYELVGVLLIGGTDTAGPSECQVLLEYPALPTLPVATFNAEPAWLYRREDGRGPLVVAVDGRGVFVSSAGSSG